MLEDQSARPGRRSTSSTAATKVVNAFALESLFSLGFSLRWIVVRLLSTQSIACHEFFIFTRIETWVWIKK